MLSKSLREESRYGGRRPSSPRRSLLFRSSKRNNKRTAFRLKEFLVIKTYFEFLIAAILICNKNQKFRFLRNRSVFGSFIVRLIQPTFFPRVYLLPLFFYMSLSSHIALITIRKPRASKWRTRGTSVRAVQSIPPDVLFVSRRISATRSSIERERSDRSQHARFSTAERDVEDASDYVAGLL